MLINNLTPHFIIIIIILPITAALLNLVLGFCYNKFYKTVTIVSLVITFILSIILALKVLETGKITYVPGNWQNVWKIEFIVDYLNAPIIVLISGLCLAIVVYSIKYIPHAIVKKETNFLYYPLFLLIVGTMQGFVLAGDLFTMFMFLSTFSLSGYTLVVVNGDKNSVIAGIKYLYMGTIASLFFLHGIAFIYAAYGTLNMNQLAIYFNNWDGNIISMVGLVLLVIAFSLKSALFPLHTWLPDAHSFAPSSVSAILSGLVVEMGAFGIIRVIYTIYGFKNIEAHFSLGNILLILASMAILMGSIGALFQDNIKTVLAYSSISQMGYIVLGIGLGNHYGMVGSMIHIINHAIMKAALFLCAGSLIQQTGTHSLKMLQGVGKKMPATVGAFILAGISIIGFPPTSGFMSKWYLCLGAIEAQKPFYVIVILLGSILSAIYYIRIFNQIYFKPEPEGSPFNIKETSWGMLFPIWGLAILSVLLGLIVKIPLMWIEKGVSQII